MTRLRPLVRITGPEGGERRTVRPQLHGDRVVAGHLRIIERSATRVVVHTRYDPGLLIERHSHLASEVIFVIEGELIVGERRCPAGTALVLEQGAAFGPITAGERGAVLFECFDGEPGHVSLDPEGFERLLAERGIALLPEPDASLPAQGKR